MPHRCSVYNCNGNYRGEPYTKTVSASVTKYPEDIIKWIEAMPNQRQSLEKIKEIHVCVSHFNCDWLTVQGGGKRPSYAPSFFSRLTEYFAETNFI